MPVGNVSTRPISKEEVFGYGQRIRTPGDDPEAMRSSLPKLQPGLAWACIGKDGTTEDDGPWVYWKAVYEGDLASEDRSGLLDALENRRDYHEKALDTRLVRDGEDPPIAAPGYEWRMLKHWSDTRNAQYGLFKLSDKPAPLRRPKLPKVNPKNTRRRAIMNSIRHMQRQDREAITTRLIRDGESLPSAKAGYEWRMLRRWSDTRNAEYGLFKVA